VSPAAKAERNRDYYSRNRSRISSKMLSRARQNRQDAIESAGGKCVKCGGTDRLQFDHIDPRQKSEHRIWTWGAERRAAELAKCQLLCEPCHRVKTEENDENHWRSKPY
jgi:5-methylcytosine-specific restriction endonuclease McrA